MIGFKVLKYKIHLLESKLSFLFVMKHSAFSESSNNEAVTFLLA